MTSSPGKSTGTATVNIAVVTAGLSDPSSTRLLADQLAAATTVALELRDSTASVEVIELRALAHALADNLLTGFATGPLEEALAAVSRADAVIAVTPVFTASYSGLFKTFFDVLDKDALEGTPTLIAATAGTARHSLVLEHAVRPLFGYLKAVVVPTAVFAASEDFGSTGGGALADRVRQAAEQLAALTAGDTTRVRRRAKVTMDNPEDTPDFEHMLASLSR
jgi:FMN reductase